MSGASGDGGHESRERVCRDLQPAMGRKPAARPADQGQQVLDMRDHLLPVQRLSMRVRYLVQLLIEVLEFGGQFLPPEL